MNSIWILMGGSLFLAAALLVPKPAFGQAGTPLPLPTAPLLLDSFADDEPSPYGSWGLSTDRVMGGISNGGASIETVEGRRAMRMTGAVRLENNGGFVQTTLRLRETMDASAFEGVFLGALAARPGAYYVFVRTSDTRMPWAYYSAPLELGEGWTERILPWSAFEAQSTRQALDPSRIRSISVVAYGEVMSADIAVDRIGLFVETPVHDAPAPPSPSSKRARMK